MIKKNAVTAFILSLTFIGGVSGQLFYKSGTFKVLDAVQMTVYPGVQGAPISTTLTFKIVMRKCAKSIQIDSFWLDGFADKVEIELSNGKDFVNKACPGDTLIVNCSYYRYNDEIINPNAPKFSGSKETKPPTKHRGKALFRYSLDGKKYYFSILDVKKRENVYAP